MSATAGALGAQPLGWEAASCSCPEVDVPSTAAGRSPMRSSLGRIAAGTSPSSRSRKSRTATLPAGSTECCTCRSTGLGSGGEPGGRNCRPTQIGTNIDF